MANLQNAVPENKPGEFFVDSTCIDCDTCRQLAPESFADAGSYSFVHQQPDTPQQTQLALHALVCCPTGSIGTRSANQARQVMGDFPRLIEADIYYCGFTSPKSFGASSYFIRHPEGNWLVDSPKYLPGLEKTFEAWGGIHTIFLTHSDDVGDVHRYAEAFGARRIIHREELWSQPESELVIEGTEPRVIHPDFVVIPTPGHTRGHCSLLYRNRFLFSGDHLWWERDEQRLGMPTHYFWNQAKQRESAEKLIGFDFEWILPGHGQRIQLSSGGMKESLRELVARWVLA